MTKKIDEQSDVLLRTQRTLERSVTDLNYMRRRVSYQEQFAELISARPRTTDSTTIFDELHSKVARQTCRDVSEFILSFKCELQERGLDNGDQLGDIVMNALRTAGLFDPQYYLEINTDVADAGLDAGQHFYKYGAAEGRLCIRI